MRVTDAMIAAWTPWWKSDLRHMSDHDLSAEMEYVYREIKECLYYDAVVDGHLEEQDFTAGQMVRLQMLQGEVERRWKFQTLVKDQPEFVVFAQKMKLQVPLQDFIVGLGYCPDMKQVGSYYVARCPLHDDHTASFFVWERPAPHWFCFGCGQGGDIYDLLMAERPREWYEAVKIVADYLHLPMPR